MAIRLELQENIKCLLPGMYHLDISEPYTPSVLGVTNDKQVVVYFDNFPSSTGNGVEIYNIRKAIPLSNVSVVMLETIDTKKHLKHDHRVVFVTSNKEEQIEFFYSKDAKKYLKALINQLKAYKVKIRKRNVLFE